MRATVQGPTYDYEGHCPGEWGVLRPRDLALVEATVLQPHVPHHQDELLPLGHQHFVPAQISKNQHYYQQNNCIICYVYTVHQQVVQHLIFSDCSTLLASKIVPGIEAVPEVEALSDVESKLGIKDWAVPGVEDVHDVEPAPYVESVFGIEDWCCPWGWGCTQVEGYPWVVVYLGLRVHLDLRVYLGLMMNLGWVCTRGWVCTVPGVECVPEVEGVGHVVQGHQLRYWFP